MGRHELSDDAWQYLRNLLPRKEPGSPGRPRRDDRTVLSGIIWVLRTGAPWRDLPGRFGPWQTVYERFARYRRAGVFDRILERLQADADAAGRIDWDIFFVDGSSVRAHRCAAGAGNRGEAGEPRDHALGRSRGGYGTKIHMVCDGNGTALAVEVTAGQVHESTVFEQLMDTVRVPRRIGRPRTRPNAVSADKAYSVRRIRTWLRTKTIRDVVPARVDQPQRRNFDREAYRRRNLIERCLGWLKECRRISTRYEKLASSFVAMLQVAMMDRYLRMVVG